MKVFSFAAIAALMAVSGIASAGGPGDHYRPWFGGAEAGPGPGPLAPPPLEEYPAVFGPGRRLPPECAGLVRPHHTPGITRLDEPFLDKDLICFIPPRFPSRCEAIKISPTAAKIYIRTAPGPVYKWIGLADDHGKIESRLQHLGDIGYCTDGVSITDESLQSGPGYQGDYAGW